jgi:mono/diheme cytochrome c family protein
MQAGTGALFAAMRPSLLQEDRFDLIADTLTTRRRRRCVAALLGAGCLLALAGSARVESEPGNAAEGLRFAEMWCSGCHPVALRVARTGGIAPDFGTIADRPETNAQALKGFLDSSHPLMPNFQLAPNEANDIIAYILSLKRPRQR